MKVSLFVIFAITSLAAIAQVPVNNHGKGAYGVPYEQVVGSDYLDDWSLVTDPRHYRYQGGTITVEYPRYVKSFAYNYRGENAQGLFAIEYNRFQGNGYLKFQIYLLWPDKTQSYFIAKKYGLNNQVTFYESDEISGITLDPFKSFEAGGAKVWAFEVLGFADLIAEYYNSGLLTELEHLTYQALYEATGP